MDAGARRTTTPPTGETKTADKRDGPEEGQATPGEIRFATALPFLVGGVLGLVVSVDLYGSSRHVGSLPLWPLVVGLSITALGAGLLLLMAEDGQETPEPETEDHVVVRRDEWARIQKELREHRSSGRAGRDGVSTDSAATGSEGGSNDD